MRLASLLLSALVASTALVVLAPAASACVPTVIQNVCIPTCLKGPNCASPTLAPVCTLRPVDRGTMVCVAPSDPSCTIAVYEVDGPQSSETCVPL